MERRGFGSTARTCAAIRVHFPGAEIVVSSWEGSGVDGLNCDEVVLSPDPGPVPPSGQNTNRQIIGSLAGIRAASRPLVAKVRSDIVFHSRALLEHRERWTARAGELRVFEQRLLVPHVYTRRPTYLSPLPHHPSDWALLGLREDLEDRKSVV